jgi:hypothetical protein
LIVIETVRHICSLLHHVYLHGRIFLSNGCKDPIIEDTDLLTADDELNLAKDSLNVKALSVYEEKTAGNTSSTAVLGSMNDPPLAKPTARFTPSCAWVPIT